MMVRKLNVVHLPGTKAVLDVLNENGEMRFGQIMSTLEERENPGVKNPAALSYRLRGLEKMGFVKKRTENETGKPVKVFYFLTNEGCEALQPLRELTEIITRASPSY